MNSLRLAVVICVTFVIGVSSVIAYSIHMQTRLQLECMELRGNWETREHSHVVGCRFRDARSNK